ncbi:hypothetical protein FB45DRAFT_740431 [Roridomyces roridus]|uniref:Uncharacterized protein n=1 Tax=Roridomyces roridus TaxID=1738132 RepID=A0AAD7FUH0_9AGAR|nr:hypothetical protein FB45DRAFT_740431 [Roridomyces roridus]
MSTATPNSRASLLSGLRTGGVRSTSAAIPHTAAPGGSFHVPRFASQHHHSVFPEEEDDQMAQGHTQNVFANHSARMPMTAAVDGPGFIQQQQRGMNPNSAPFNPSFLTQASAQAQTQAFQMQMMQLEIMKMQTIQAQQYQAQILAAQMQQQQQQAQPSPRRVSFNPPATAGPLQSSFDLRSATLSAQMRRAAQNVDEQQVPMTAALGGRFGARPAGSRFTPEEDDTVAVPSTPHVTTVISGGTSLGSPASNNVTPNGTPSKSDSVSNWRRGGNNNSVLSGNNRSPSVKVTPPPAESPVATPSPVGKSRPQPLRFSLVASQPMPVIAIDNVEGDGQEIELEADASSGSSKSVGSNPTTPPSSSSIEMPLSPREEASKKLYEGLGIGRPVSVVNEPQQLASVAGHRMASQPVRQPRGPPSGADELGPKNFATRIRRKAIGGLGMLMTSRERREVVEAY